MELSKQDITLLSYLYQSGREPITKIAKECKLSREQVNYKLKKFQDEGLIKKFVTIFNYPSLGYPLWSAMLIKSKKDINLINIKNVIVSSKIIGDYDYFITFVSKNEQKLKETILEIIQENSEIIKDYMLINPYFTQMYPLKFIQKEQTFDFLESFEKQNLNKDEIKILKILEKDARAKITEIAHKIGISAELALYKLRNLQKKKIILGTKIQLDITKLGFHYSVILINMLNFTKEIENKIKKFAKQEKFCNSLMLSIHKPQITIQAFYKNQEELNLIINNLKNLFKNEIKHLKIMFPQQEKDINTLPILENNG